MNKEIKERIETIKKCEVPDGYKRTRMGIIPNEWREVQLRDIAKAVTKKNIDNSITVTFTNSATKGVIKQTDYFEKQISNSENTSGYYVVEQDDYIYNPRISDFAPCGPINKSNFEENGIVSPLYTVFKLRNDLKKNKYIEMYLNSSFWHRYMCSVANYGARHDRMNITNNDFFRMPVPFPPLEEQQKIAEILSRCDTVIEECEKQVEEYKNLKKTCLSKMFPKKGSNVPEIRFPGFTDTWEQRKLSSLCVKFTDGDWIEAKDQSNSGVRLIQTGNVGVAEYLDKPNNKKWVSEDTFEALHCEEVFGGDILISRLPEPAGRACIVPNLGTKMITAVDCTIVRVSENINNEFLLQYLSSQKYFDEVNTCLAGGTRQRISRSNLADFDIMLPTKKQEQQQIGAFFRNLDNLITLHQRKADEYRQMKKSLTQLLISGIVRT